MPGLLDARGGFNDPITMGLLGASQALLTPMSQGGGLGAAFGAFPAAQQAAEQRRMRELMLQAQMGNMQSEAEYRNAQMEGARQKAMREAQIEAGRSALFGEIAAQGMPDFKDASFSITGVPPTADYVAPQNRRLSLTPQIAARAAGLGIKPDELAAVFNAGRQKVERTIEGRGPDGSPQTQQFDQFGSIVGAGIPKAVEMRFLNTGGSQVGYNPFTLGLTGPSIANTMSPGESARLTQDRAPAGYRINPDNTMSFIPGGPADPANKLNGQPTEDERKASGWLDQATNAYKNMLAAISKDPNAATPGFADAVAGTPFIGQGAAQMMRGPERQKFLQAAGSLSEALLRAATGAGVNESEARQKIVELVPQIGDTEDNRQQKMDAIPMYLESLKTRANRAAPQGYVVPEMGASDAVAPVQARISSGFGPRTAPKAGASSNHAGVDYAVPVGTAVAASKPGRVSAVGNEPGGYGNFVTVEHPGGFTTTYAHLDGSRVNVGDQVRGGQIIAMSGNSGNSTGPHLHFKVTKDGVAIDPSRFLSGSGAKRGIGTQQVSGQIGAVGQVADNDPLGIRR
jgi:murein DD-endopeptidase MepM/ murein hydrolase activator NlpD